MKRSKHIFLGIRFKSLILNQIRNRSHLQNIKNYFLETEIGKIWIQKPHKTNQTFRFRVYVWERDIESESAGLPRLTEIKAALEKALAGYKSRCRTATESSVTIRVLLRGRPGPVELTHLQK